MDLRKWSQSQPKCSNLLDSYEVKIEERLNSITKPFLLVVEFLRSISGLTNLKAPVPKFSNQIWSLLCHDQVATQAIVDAIQGATHCWKKVCINPPMTLEEKEDPKSLGVKLKVFSKTFLRACEALQKRIAKISRLPRPLNRQQVVKRFLAGKDLDEKLQRKRKQKITFELVWRETCRFLQVNPNTRNFAPCPIAFHIDTSQMNKTDAFEEWLFEEMQGAVLSHDDRYKDPTKEEDDDEIGDNKNTDRKFNHAYMFSWMFYYSSISDCPLNFYVYSRKDNDVPGGKYHVYNICHAYSYALKLHPPRTPKYNQLKLKNHHIYLEDEFGNDGGSSEDGAPWSMIYALYVCTGKYDAAEFDVDSGNAYEV